MCSKLYRVLQRQNISLFSLKGNISEVDMKFKLKKENMMASISDGGLEVDPKIPGLAETTKWWKKIDGEGFGSN